MDSQKRIQDLGLSDMKKLLSWLNKYSDMTKKLGSRWAHLFHKSLSWSHDYVVEYYSSLWEAAAYEQALWVYKKSFGQLPKREEITFINNDSVKGGMKVYFDDSLVDVSFKKVEDILQK